MTKQEIINKVVEAREELRTVVSEMAMYEHGLSDREKFEIEKRIEEGPLTTLSYIILASDFEEKRKRDGEAQEYVSSENKNL